MGKQPTCPADVLEDIRKRLIRVETRVTNHGRYTGIDLTQRPRDNEPKASVYVDPQGAVFTTATATVADLAMAIRRHPDLLSGSSPVYLNGIYIGDLTAGGDGE